MTLPEAVRSVIKVKVNPALSDQGGFGTDLIKYQGAVINPCSLSNAVAGGNARNKT